jgi:hypothetical protein
LLTANGILLVRERERGRSDAGKRGLVIQRSVRGGNHAGAKAEGDVLEAEGLRAAFAVAVEVFGGAKEPEETHDAEKVGVAVGAAVLGVGEVEDSRDVADDGDVGRVGSGGWVVGVTEGLEESSE